MAESSKRFNWQVSFGVTHQLEYGELIDFYNKLPKMQQGAIGRKLLQAGLQSLKKAGDPLVLRLLEQEQQKENSETNNTSSGKSEKQLVKPQNKLNKKVLGLLDS
ncbi:hypothetical protein SAMN05660649_04792 [Desulfotomaculum arcticum]|uniref:Uncharacterized protein n=1 Tax=Desulfotruncus arcticus DSM 17038 TaxID=1121424 RepID=A0A1I2Z858_9FIRM|nr:hypothetical protein [Desulfotruncus arcticus]SFH33686.1 hypothetical protein SAMN05660649_04792 [Desulfotomaculum arcticum] [Desulfotruncus arcticus DSM 17038]